MKIAETAGEGWGEDGFETVPEAAKFLGLSKTSLYGLMETGMLPYAKFGKSRRIPRKALRAYAERCIIPAREGVLGEAG